MAKKKKKSFVKMACSKCDRINYFPPKPKDPEKKLEMKKHCKWCKEHTVHKQKT